MNHQHTTTAAEYRQMANLARTAGDLTQAARYERLAKTAPTHDDNERKAAAAPTHDRYNVPMDWDAALTVLQAYVDDCSDSDCGPITPAELAADIAEWAAAWAEVTEDGLLECEACGGVATLRGDDGHPYCVEHVAMGGTAEDEPDGMDDYLYMDAGLLPLRGDGTDLPEHNDVHLHDHVLRHNGDFMTLWCETEGTWHLECSLTRSLMAD